MLNEQAKRSERGETGANEESEGKGKVKEMYLAGTYHVPPKGRNEKREDPD